MFIDKFQQLISYIVAGSYIREGFQNNQQPTASHCFNEEYHIKLHEYTSYDLGFVRTLSLSADKY